jgi:tetratricopeptide (TPR) repeat protein
MKNFRYLLICGLMVYFTIATKAQKITQVYSGTLKYNSLEKQDFVKNEFSDMLSKVYYVQTDKSIKTPHYIPEDKGLVVTQESVSFSISKSKKYTFLFSNNQDIKVLEYSYLGKVYEIELPNLTVYWKTKDLEFAKKFADDLVYFQNMLHFVRVKEVKDFDSIAAQYLTLKVKPPISEQARKYIVQANAQTQLKDYKRAIEFYEKAIEVDPANPMVYNNQALLLAIVGQYDAAINSMRKYLKLVPEASDARAAQDKIYEWEVNITK